MLAKSKAPYLHRVPMIVAAAATFAHRQATASLEDCDLVT